ncbi:hypothetical protein F750_3934 [Streptomyces sp. PAMC 26508]|nr:hypothetical protein F750_3934 [Streptomyces sp. PAMC 26508]
MLPVTPSPQASGPPSRTDGPQVAGGDRDDAGLVSREPKGTP